MGRTADLALARRCRAQFGVFTFEQALADGVPKQTVVVRLRLGRYVQRAPGVYADAAVADRPEARWLAAQYAIGGDAALARRTAAVAHGLELRRAPDRIHLVVHNRSYAPPPSGVVVHRASRYHEAQVCTSGPLRLTVVERTLCDLAPVVPFDELRSLLAQAVRKQLTDGARVQEMVGCLGGFRGKRRLLPLLDELSPLEGTAASEAESLFLRIATTAGLPPTALNHPVTDAFGATRYIDAVYLPERLPVEIDSKSYHGSVLDLHDDRRREEAIKLVGWRDFVRFGYADLRHRPDYVVEVLRRALAEAATSTQVG